MGIFNSQGKNEYIDMYPEEEDCCTGFILTDTYSGSGWKVSCYNLPVKCHAPTEGFFSHLRLCEDCVPVVVPRPDPQGHDKGS